ncbi:MAG: AMP-binding protein [Brevundimonas sp.]|uniref:AMP-binding protein n=1 Tax=Brevundimonas sp. TaxID=1871086 RepID=UPI00271E2BF1|nr:AMP-binding protein [Brevundimonas sp.]MDO9078155.1 AMP-binding protein [Brevundimonas sp.]
MDLRVPLDPRHVEETVFDALISAREKFGDKEILEDLDRKPLTYTGLIRSAFVLGRKIAAMTDLGERVGILLPSSSGVVVTYFGLHAHGRVPVMLNFTSGQANIKAAIKAAGLKKVLSAKRFINQAKLEDLMDELGKVAEIVWLDDIRKTIGLQDKAYGLLAGMLPRQFRVRTEPSSTGVILFTSGSFGAPKGVVLSQWNLVANCRQASQYIDLKPEWVMFNPLPTFHCFGLTGGVMLPLLNGMKAFQYPSPLHAKQIVELLPEVKASILFATDTFLNQYARVASPDDFDTLEFVVAGAERVRPETHHLFNTRFHGLKLLEGYGATEAAPVVAINHPDRNRPGTVGQMIPGMEWRLDPVEGIPDGGRLFLRGPNVMQGYLSPDDPDIVEPLAGGWHDTGDIVDIDKDGYVSILGRIKRFAKIGGEMVSLTAVEGLASAVWPEARHAVVSIPDARKGEKLVLVTDRRDADVARLAEWARSHGAPELAVPKKILRVAEVPVLGTGKTDYVRIQQMAELDKAA